MHKLNNLVLTSLNLLILFSSCICISCIQDIFIANNPCKTVEYLHVDILILPYKHDIVPLFILHPVVNM